MQSKGPANLTQIAQDLGLSVTTVSRALKDGPEVHPDTRARVKEVATRLGYVPNLHGRALRTGRTQRLTAILPLETREYLSDIAKLPLIEGMTLAAKERGYSLSIHSTTPEEDPQESLLQVIQAGTSDGVIITRMRAADARVPFLLDRGIPFVTFGRSDQDLDYAYVDVDNEAIAHDATRRLIAMGCQRIALQNLVIDDQFSTSRLRGYLRAIEEAGLYVDMDLVGHEDFTIAASQAWVEHLLTLPEPPTGLICANELGLFGTLSALRLHGLTPGTEMRVLLRDNTRICRYIASDLGAHVVDLAAIGQSLIAALVTQIESPTVPKVKDLIGAEFEWWGLDLPEAG